MPGNDSYTKLLIHSDDTDGSTSFVDSSGSGHIITANGNVHHETDQKKFGKSAVHCDAVGDSLTVASHADFDPGSGDFTIDGWFYFTAFAIQILFTKRATSANYAPYIVYVDTLGVPQVLLSTDGATFAVNFSGSALSLNIWTHIELVRDGGTIRLFVGGVADGTGAISGSLMTNTDAFSIGANADNTYSLNGYFDELRFSNGIARNTAAFTPMVGPYTIPFSSWSQSKKIQLSIPAQSSILTNFPVLAYLSATSGTDDTDVTDPITELAADVIFNPDDKDAGFTLSSGNSVATLTVTNSWRSVRCTGGLSSGKHYFEFEYTDYIGNAMFGVAGAAASLAARIGDSSVGWAYNGSNGQKYHDNAGTAYGDTLVTDGDIIGVAIDMDAGKIWFSKNGVWQDSGNPAAGTGEAYSGLSGTVYPALSAYSNSTKVTTQFFASELSHTAPSGFSAISYDNSLKIAVEDVASGNECYVEKPSILWNPISKTALLWMKVPSISATSATILNLYYDPTQDDNTGYIGDIGSVQGQNVWDSNFIRVYHMCQDPSGGANCIKDSTSNGGHGTPSGSMTASDLVDNTIGKGIEFDATDDAIDTGIASLTDPYTIEMVFHPANTNRGILFSNFAGSAGDFSIEWSSGTPGDIYVWDDTPSGGDTVSSVLSAALHNFGYAVDGNGNTSLIVDGVLDGSTSDNQGALSSGSNYQIGNRPNDNNFVYEGIVGETRISNIERSVVWRAVTKLSNTDALIAYSIAATSVTVRTFFEQVYNLENAIVVKIMEQVYSLPFPIIKQLEQIYGLRMLAMLSQPYSNAPVVLKQLLQYYGSAAKVTQVLIQLYDDMHMIRTSLEQPYSYPAFLQKVMEQKYSIAGTQLLAMSNQLYSIQGTDLVRQQLLQPFSIASGESQLLTYVTHVAVNGSGGEFDLKFHHINIEASRDQYCMSCEVHLAGQPDYIRCKVLDDLTITIDGEVFEFFVESKQRNRGHGTAEYTVKGLSKTALLDAPYAEPITDDLSGMASQIVVDLAAGFTVNWDTVDWHIQPNTLMPADQSPLEIIRDVAAAAGAILQTEPDGSLTVEPAYPVPVNQWPTTAIDHHLSDALDFFTTGENYDHRPGYNRYLVSDQLTSEDTLRLEEEAITSATKYIMAYQTPWVDDFTLRHTGGVWITLEPLGIEQRLIEDEIVEFVAGVGSTAYPIYARVAVEWLQTNLGTVTFAEDGTLESSIAGESLLKISYRTRCRKYLATDHEDEQVQLVAEGVD